MEYIHGTGAIIDKKDKRDYQFKDIAMGLSPFDWTLGYDIEQVIKKLLNSKDQNGSGSCGGQAWGYYGEVLDPENEEKSAKFIYSNTFVLPAGSAGRTNCDFVIKKGWGDERITPSYDNGLPPSEAFMQRHEDISNEAWNHALLDKGLSYANVASNIDDIALAIRENKGCILGVHGTNNGTWLSKFPTPPITINNQCWAHWLYAGKAVMINEKKYIGVKNSWGDEVGEHGWQYLGEEYFKKAIWSVWTMVYDFPIFKFSKTMKLGSFGSEVKQLQKRLGLSQDGIFGLRTRGALIKYQISHGLKGDGICGILTINSLNK